ncbi:hypothetical protein JTB14_003203 [Gonioctena quinquepunctata]|nr:hypothetical protein JTB14_003203 [Gonioctena quinquepunctata]
MEPSNEFSATKRCTNIQEDFVSCSEYSTSFQANLEEPPHQTESSSNGGHSYTLVHPSNDEEPIDLTFTSRYIEESAGGEAFNNFIPKLEVPVIFPHGNIRRNYGMANAKRDFVPNLDIQPFQIVNCSGDVFVDRKTDYYPDRKRKRSKFVYTKEGKLILVTEDPSQMPTSFSPAKKQEILKAAKSLFSKRTRTLYHWMYPNAAKQQIKTAVTTSWESLADNEKEFYISQVLGRFGFPQTDLMINPQLGSIRELPPPPPPVEKVEVKPKIEELECALSSITPPVMNACPIPMKRGPQMSLEDFEKVNERFRKKRG